MFNFLDFIDSPDIRRFNENTVFTPMEQAVLIWHSKKRTVEEKLAAWHELLDTYSEEEFEMMTGNINKDSNETNKEILQRQVDLWENALEKRYTASNVVFEAYLMESEYPDNIDLFYFSSYDQAYAYLQSEKQKYLDSEYLRDVLTEARITMTPMDVRQKGLEDAFLFDMDLRMVNIYENDEEIEDKMNMLDFFVYVPIPFRKGDILKTLRHGEPFYAVLPRDIDKNYFARELRSGDGTSMQITMDYFYDSQTWEGGGIPFLELEKSSDTELPEEVRVLRMLSDVYRGKMEAGELLELFSKKGKNAWEHLYSDWNRMEED